MLDNLWRTRSFLSISPEIVHMRNGQCLYQQLSYIPFIRALNGCCFINELTLTLKTCLFLWVLFDPYCFWNDSWIVFFFWTDILKIWLNTSKDVLGTRKAVRYTKLLPKKLSILMVNTRLTKRLYYKDSIFCKTWFQ